MKRRAFGILAVLSAMLCQACAVSWWWSYHGNLGDYRWCQSSNGGQAYTKAWAFETCMGLMQFQTYWYIGPESDAAQTAESRDQGRRNWWGAHEIHFLQRADDFYRGRWLYFGTGAVHGGNQTSRVFGVGVLAITVHELNDFDKRSRTVTIQAPWFLPTALAGILPVVWLALWARRRYRLSHARAGLCAVCGYDMRATPDRCPECGTIAKRRTHSTRQARQDAKIAKTGAEQTGSRFGDRARSRF